MSALSVETQEQQQGFPPSFDYIMVLPIFLSFPLYSSMKNERIRSMDESYVVDDAATKTPIFFVAIIIYCCNILRVGVASLFKVYVDHFRGPLKFWIDLGF
jgi:hypothetical protein